MKKDFIDIIMPAHNMQDCIAKALKSLYEQSYKKIRVIIINDCSTDKTIDVINLFKNKLDIFIINNQKQEGSGQSRNIALNHVSSEFFMFIDADDYLSESDYLTKMINTQKQNDADIVYSGYTKVFSNKTNYITPNKNINANNAVQSFLDFEFGTHASWAKLYKSTLLSFVNFGLYGFSIDVIFGLKAFFNISKIEYCDSFGYVYSRIVKSIWNTNTFNIEHFYSSFRLIVEVYDFCENNKYYNFSTTKFEKLWMRDHYPRIVKFLRSKDIYKDIPYLISILKEIVPLKFKILPLIKNLIVRNILDILSFKSSSFNLNETQQKYIKYLHDIVGNYEKFLKSTSPLEERIALIYVSHLSKGGLERMAINYANILDELGYKIYIFIDKEQDSTYSCKHEIIRFKNLNTEILNIIYNCTFFFDFKYKKTTSEFPLIKFVIDRFPEKYIATVHNTETCCDYIDKIVSYSTTRPFSNFKSILCVSNKVKQSVIERYPTCDLSKVNVIDNFIDIHIDHNILNTKYEYILFVGRLDATLHKGIDILIDAYSKSQTPFKLLLIGANRLSNDVLQKIKQSPRSNDIKIHGFTNDIYKYMATAKFVVISSRYEGNQLALLEALYCGTPVVSTKVGASEEIIKDNLNGYLVETNNVDDLTSKIDLMSLNCNKLRENCTESVKKYSKENFKQNLNKILNSNNISDKNYDDLMLISRFINLVSFINLKETNLITKVSNIQSSKNKSYIKLIVKKIYKFIKSF